MSRTGEAGPLDLAARTRRLVSAFEAGELDGHRLDLAAALGDEAARAARESLASRPRSPAAPEAPRPWFARILGGKPRPGSNDEGPWLPRREPHPEDYREVRLLPSAERRARLGALGLEGASVDELLRRRAALETEGLVVWTKDLVRNVDDAVFDAAASVGRPALARVALAAARAAAEDALSPEQRAGVSESPRSLVTTGEVAACEAILALAASSLDTPGPVAAADASKAALAAAVERNREIVQGIRITGPDFGYTTRFLIACYLLADLLASEEREVVSEDARDVVAHAEGYYLERWTPLDRATYAATVREDTIARAEALVLGAVRAAVVPWALS